MTARPGRRDKAREGLRDAVAERLDDRRALVAQHDRAFPLPVAVPDVQVEWQTPAASHPDPDLAWTGRRELSVSIRAGHRAGR